MYQAQAQKPKLDDGKRIQRILDELNAKYADRKGGQSQIMMDEQAKQMFIDYANELTISVLEASALLAQHRHAKTIDAEDVNLVLGKKLGIEFPGLIKQSHNSGTEGVTTEGPSGAPTHP